LTSHDAGISGSKGRDGRPGLDSMLKDAQRRSFDVVMAWAIDRLGRSLIDLLGTIQALEACGVDLYLEGTITQEDGDALIKQIRSEVVSEYQRRINSDRSVAAQEEADFVT
jgi:DNA invertase Pin-like site-specific DNA recombinase